MRGIARDAGAKGQVLRLLVERTANAFNGPDGTVLARVLEHEREAPVAHATRGVGLAKCGVDRLGDHCRVRRLRLLGAQTFDDFEHHDADRTKVTTSRRDAGIYGDEEILL